MVAVWPTRATIEPFGLSLSLRAMICECRRRPRRDRAPGWSHRSPPSGEMSYCETTASLCVRRMSAMPPSTVVGAPRGVDGQILQRRQRVELVLRGLQRDRIGDAVLLVQPVGGRHLAGAREVDDQAVGHVGRGHAGVLRARAVDVDIERRLRGRLLDARIGDARNMPDLRQELVGVGVSPRRDRCREPADRSVPARRN